MNYRLLITTNHATWEEHFESLGEAETRVEQLQQAAEDGQAYCNLTLLQVIADITIQGKEHTR